MNPSWYKFHASNASDSEYSLKFSGVLEVNSLSIAIILNMLNAYIEIDLHFLKSVF